MSTSWTYHLLDDGGVRERPGALAEVPVPAGRGRGRLILADDLPGAGRTEEDARCDKPCSPRRSSRIDTRTSPTGRSSCATPSLDNAKCCRVAAWVQARVSPKDIDICNIDRAELSQPRQGRGRGSQAMRCWEIRLPRWPAWPARWRWCSAPVTSCCRFPGHA